jgi:hypothetical protein
MDSFIDIRSLPMPICIADGDNYCPITEQFEQSLKDNKIPFDECYGLYKKQIDLSQYKTICFYSTGVYPEKVKEIMNFDYFNLEVVVAIGDYAIDLVRNLCKFHNKRLLGYSNAYESLFSVD